MDNKELMGRIRRVKLDELSDRELRELSHGEACYWYNLLLKETEMDLESPPKVRIPADGVKDNGYFKNICDALEPPVTKK